MSISGLHKLKRTRYIIAAGLIAYVSAFAIGTALADQYSDQINNLRAENGSLQAQNQALANEAIGFQAKIDNLQNEIQALQAQINANEIKHQQLLAKIAETQAEIDLQKVILGQNIKAMYLEGEISTFEILASSNDLSTFVDKEQYRNTVKDKVTQTLDTITALKKQLDDQKTEVEKILADQRTIQAQLDAQRAEQARLLSLNQAERDKLDAELKNNNSEINNLRRQQAASNARLFGSGIINASDTSGYPWSGVGFPNSSADPWGMYKRQCVSYTAWRVADSGRYMPYWGGHGNANQWDENARTAGIPVDGSPRVGDVAVSNSGYYGHVMYVEAVYGDGTIYVSQYNASWTGTYSEARVSTSGLVFIHF